MSLLCVDLMGSFGVELKRCNQIPAEIIISRLSYEK